MPKLSKVPALLLGTLALALAAPAAPALAQGRVQQPQSAAEQPPPRAVLRVRIDEASVLSLSRPAQTLVIGNPSIADAVVHDGGTIIVTGKSFGTTNIIAMDRAGQIIMERQLHVGQPESSIVTVQRGDEIETYSCAPQCRPTLMIGDTPRVFQPAFQQQQNRNSAASTGGTTPGR